MKSKIITMLLVLVVALVGTSSVFARAEDVSATLVPSKTDVKPGETFTVTLHATCSEKINGIQTEYNYDSDVLEVVSANTASGNFANLGINNKIEVIANAPDITDADVFVITFKVKDNAKTNTTTQISMPETLVASMEATDSNYYVPEQTITINIVGDSTENPGTTNPENPDEENPGTTNPDDQDKPGTTDPDDQDKPGTTNPGDDNNNNNNNNNNSNNSNKGNTSKDDNTTAPGKLPYTGTSIVAVAIIGLSIILVVTFIRNRKYRDVK